MEAEPTVYVVDSDSGARASLRVLMKSLRLSTASFASAQEFLASYRASQSGCLLLDIRLPGMSGLELQDELNRRGYVIPLIFVTGYGDVPMAVEAMRRGAGDFIQKPFRDQDLIDCVQKALARDHDTREGLQEYSRICTRLASLTPREHDVLELLIKGQANKVMARELALSQRTVEIHRARVMNKMEAGSLAQLIRMVVAIESRVIPAAP
ncbi:MAG: response regulator [Gammaproteobacteria bacterium]